MLGGRGVLQCGTTNSAGMFFTLKKLHIKQFGLPLMFLSLSNCIKSLSLFEPTQYNFIWNVFPTTHGNPCSPLLTCPT